MSKYKVGDIVLVKSIAGDAIPNIHVKLVKRITVKTTKGKTFGFKKMPDWEGYSGWEAEVVFQEEIDMLRKEWSIPFSSPGEETFVFDKCIIKKPREPKPKSRRVNKNTKIRKRRKVS